MSRTWRPRNHERPTEESFRFSIKHSLNGVTLFEESKHMGRKSIVHEFIGKQIGGISILGRSPSDGTDRLKVRCKCLTCEKEFTATFHNVYRGNYKSCGCLQHALGNRNPKWKGHGEISQAVFYALKRGAEQRNLSFDISIEYIWDLFLQQKRKCILSGQSLRFPLYRDDNTGTASLDRIDARIGYRPDNVQWVHKDINFMKQEMDNQEFIKMISLIYKHTRK